MKLTTSFKKISKTRTALNKVIQGSQGAAKTYSILLRWILMAAKSKNVQLCSIVTDTFPNLRSGAIKDFEEICRNEGIQYYSTKTPYKFVIGKWTFEFFSVDKETKGLGGRRDRLFINEANRIPWKTARQLINRTHKERIFDFNPVQSFWVHEQFVNIGDCAFVRLTYKDNECLPKSEVDSIEKHAPWGALPDPNYWRVYGLGEIGFVEGQIFWYEKYSELPEGQYQTSVGMDFGWEDPCAMVKSWVDHKKKHLYWKQLFYGSRTKYDKIMNEYSSHVDFDKNDIILCDHEPRDINTIREMGFNAMSAIKNSLPADIRTLKQYKIFIHEDSLDLQREMNAYKYQEKKGVIIDYPDQDCEEHAIDAGRYASIFTITRT